MKILFGSVVILSCLQMSVCAEQIVVDGTIPGGNGRLLKSEGDRLVVEYEIRDTDVWWFRWCFAVRGAQGRTLTFKIQSDKFGAGSGAVGDFGFAVSHDGGRTWRYEKGVRSDRHGFEYAFGPGDQDVRFAQCLQYDPSHWQSFLAAHANDHAFFREETLTISSRRGRPVPLTRFGNLSNPKYKLLLTSRHHSNEAVPNYVVEGIAAQVFAQDELGEWTRKNVQMIVVPFVDFDGVVDGDQGKNRTPRDHNRDYHPSRKPLYAEIAAIERIVREERPDVVMDFHNPAIHSVGRLFQTGLPDPEDADRQRSFARILERTQKGAFTYLASDDVPFGVRWNTASNYKKGQTLEHFAADELRGKGSLVTLWEVPFANAHGGKTLSDDDFRDLGRDIVEALSVWLAHFRAETKQAALKYKLLREENSRWGQALECMRTAMERRPYRRRAAVHADGAMRGRAAVPSAAANRQDGGSPCGRAGARPS